MKTLLLCLIAAASIVRTSTSPIVTARVKGPMGLTIDAVSHEAYIKDDGKTTSFIIPVSSFKTGIDLRDKHMLDAIESFQYPVAVLVISDEELQKNSTECSAELTFHGEKKQVRVRYTRDASTYDASFDLDLRDFKVMTPSYAGVTVRPNVQVTARVDVSR